MYYEKKKIINKRATKTDLLKLQLEANRFVLRMVKEHRYAPNMVWDRLDKIFYSSDLKQLARNTLSMYKALYRKTTFAKEQKKSSEIYRQYKNFVLNNNWTNKTVNQTTDYLETKRKVYSLTSIIAWNRWNIKLNRYTPFFICNTVKNCAKDHQDYEGQMYYDEGWQKRISPNHPEYENITRYIEDNQLYSIQYITTHPPYLTTRKNCRHTFHTVSISTVLSSSPSDIIKDNDLELKQLAPVSYELGQWKHYQNKLNELNSIQSILPCKELRQDIISTERLVKKWRDRVVGN